MGKVIDFAQKRAEYIAHAKATGKTTYIGIPKSNGREWSPWLSYQVRAMCARTKFVVLQQGRGTGKTATLLAKAITEALAWRKMRVLFLIPQRSQFADAIFPKLEAMNEAYRNQYNKDLIVKFNKSPNDQRCWLRGGQEIVFRTAGNLESARGGEYGIIAIDEGADVDASERSWAAFLPCLRGYGPLKMFVAGTPKGPAGVLGLLLAMADKGDPNVTVIRACTLDNPHIDLDSIRWFKRTMSPQMYEQEIEGKLLRRTGLVYGNFSVARNIWPGGDFNARKRLHSLERGERWDYCVVLDWGPAQSHASWIAHRFAGNTEHPEAVLFHERPFDQTPVGSMLAAVWAVCESLGKPPVAVICDPNGTVEVKTARRFFRDERQIDVLMERNRQRTEVATSIELVRTALGGDDGQRVYCWLAPELLRLDCNQTGGKGTYQGFLNYHFPEVAGRARNKPWDDNHWAHAMDTLRYFWLNVHRLGYEWDSVHYEPAYAATAGR